MYSMSRRISIIRNYELRNYSRFTSLYVSNKIIAYSLFHYFRTVNRSAFSSVPHVSDGHVRNRVAVKPTAAALSRKFRAKAVWHKATAQGVNPADTDLEAISQHGRAITPLRLSESRFERALAAGRLP